MNWQTNADYNIDDMMTMPFVVQTNEYLRSLLSNENVLFFSTETKKNLNNNIRCEIAIIIVSTGRNTRKPVQILSTNQQWHCKANFRTNPSENSATFNLS